MTKFMELLRRCEQLGSSVFGGRHAAVSSVPNCLQTSMVMSVLTIGFDYCLNVPAFLGTVGAVDW